MKGGGGVKRGAGVTQGVRVKRGAEVARICHPERSEGPGRFGRHAAPATLSPRSLATLGMTLLFLLACRRDMVDRPAHRPLGASAFFVDRTASRPLVADVVPREPAQRSVITGREQYKIYCMPCHGAHGEGNGIIVQHGFPRPADIRSATPQQIINAITFGKGTMYRIPQADAQSIAQYVPSLR